jgi:hypothetical protein
MMSWVALGLTQPTANNSHCMAAFVKLLKQEVVQHNAQTFLLPFPKQFHQNQNAGDDEDN